MTKPANVLEVFLQPGECYWGNHETRIRTLLGSCVSMTFWHPKKKIGGMTHIMLPKRTVGQAKSQVKEGVLDAKYGDESILLMMQEIKRHNTAPEEYQVKLFGGGNMLQHSKQAQKDLIGSKNSEIAKQLLNAHGFEIHAKHIGGLGHRSIVFDVWSGYVWMKHSPLMQIEVA